MPSAEQKAIYQKHKANIIEAANGEVIVIFKDSPKIEERKIVQVPVVLPQEAPVLTAKDMAIFLMANPLEYRKRCLLHLSNIHTQDYVESVKKLMIAIHDKNKASQ